MRVISVPDLCCPNCVAKIEKALEEVGVMHFEVSLENKTVSVCDCDTCEGNALDCLEELGFTAERIA